jgi:hypothetical protein
MNNKKPQKEKLSTNGDPYMIEAGLISIVVYCIVEGFKYLFRKKTAK